MEILSVSLKNFKSHQDRHFEFQSGCNAICGENGAGKTSIIEAIAWTLFNHTDYSKDELVRKGAKNAQVTVVFISSLDGRSYRVKRSTSRGYELYDPQLNCKLDYSKSHDVTLWLKQHIGVDSETDLPKLFAEVIGIPQGTFTVDFLKRASDRKKVFDPILKVEEYKQAFAQSKELENYADERVKQLERDLVLYEERLKDWNDLQQQQRQIAAEIEREERELQTLDDELNQLQQRQDEIANIADKIQQFASQLQDLDTRIFGDRQADKFRQESLQNSRLAVQICTDNKDGFCAYEKTESLLEELTSKETKKQELLRQREERQTLFFQRQTELNQLKVQLQGLQNARQEIEKLKSLVERQRSLELKQQEIEDKFREFQGYKLEQETVGDRLVTLQDNLNRLQKELNNLRKLEPIIEGISELEKNRNRYQEKLSRIEAAQQFSLELHQLIQLGEQKQELYISESRRVLAKLESLLDIKVQVQPILQMGASINAEILESLGQILTDISQQDSATQLEQQLQQLQGQLDRAYQCRARWTTLEDKRREERQLGQEIKKGRSRFFQLEAILKEESNLVKEREELASQLQALDNPRGKSQLLVQELQKAAQVQVQFDKMQLGEQKIIQEIEGINTRLAGLADLEVRIEEQRQLQQQHRSAYLNYLKHEDEAGKLPTLERELEEAIARLKSLEAQRLSLQTQQEELTKTYNPQQLLEIETDYNTKRNRQAQLEGSLPPKHQQLEQLNEQLANRQAVAEKRDRSISELAERKNVLQLIRDARQVYNQASPRITKFYLDEISREADKLFRELLDRQNVALEWTEDYEIIVQEDGHRRSFKSLSGGEQMCAALAVRLALLRILADIDVAFFDEPTTNMDRTRRQQLADAIANLKTFRQLFAIGHDDTFENMSNLIHVQRQ